jgi:hypothetical protein
MYANSMTDKELTERISVFLCAVEFIEAGLDNRDEKIVRMEANAMYEALSVLYAEQAKRGIS